MISSESDWDFLIRQSKTKVNVIISHKWFLYGALKTVSKEPVVIFYYKTRLSGWYHCWFLMSQYLTVGVIFEPNNKNYLHTCIFLEWHIVALT